MTQTRAYLVLKRLSGYGSVCEMQPSKRYFLGRAETNEIVLPDELCSRQHAELFASNGDWCVRDCQSMNGTRVNDKKIDRDRPLRSGDEISLGRSRLVFVQRLEDLPPLLASDPNIELGGISIVNRLGQTRFDLNASSTTTPNGVANWYQMDMERVTTQLSLLYRMALKMGEASDNHELVNSILEDLLDATPADNAAVLVVTDRQELKLTAIKAKDKTKTNVQLPAAVLQEVLRTRQAVLAEDKNRLRNPKGAENGISSLICTPVIANDRIEYLLELTCSNPLQALSIEDLELSVAIARQLGVHSQRLSRQIALQEENQRLKAQVADEVQLIGASPAILAIESEIVRAGPTNATVMIRGESGVGKELVARAIHLASPRRGQPMVCLNCAALAESLLESELFGHERGAFTGATERKIGKFEAANGGTVFLDEIGEMPASAQAKLLRILEGHPYERVGGSEPVRVNVRVVAATNRPLEEAVNEGQFRKDLYFRLLVVEIRVPPLRERGADIPLLAEHFLKRFREETGHKVKGFTAQALEKMIAYAWPGNIRELRNVVERAVAMSAGPMLDRGDIWLSNLEAQQQAPVAAALQYQPMSLEELEKRHTLDTLQHTGWVKSQAAQILGIERSTLDRKIKQFDLKKD